MRDKRKKEREKLKDKIYYNAAYQIKRTRNSHEQKIIIIIIITFTFINQNLPYKTNPKVNKAKQDIHRL